MAAQDASFSEGYIVITSGAVPDPWHWQTGRQQKPAEADNGAWALESEYLGGIRR